MGLLATACCTSLTVQAQPSTLPYADYWRTDGPIRAAAATNGILYIGGDFTYVGPASGSAGVWDTATQSARPFPILQSLNSQVLSVVHTAVSDGAGGWFLGGQFNTAIVGISNLVHVTADGGLDTAFKPNPDQPVRALLLSGNRLYVGGDFNNIGGADNAGLAIVDPASGKPISFRVQVNGSVEAFSLDGTTLYLGGSFNNILTFTGPNRVYNFRRNIAALDVNTLAFTPWSSDPTLGVAGTDVRSIAVVGSVVYVGGSFTQAGNKPRRSIAALNNTTGDATSWNPNPQDSIRSDPYVNTLFAETSGLFVGGNFTAIGSRNRTNVAQLLLAGVGQATATFSADTDKPVFQIARSEKGSLVIAGKFSTIAGQAHSGLAKLSGTPLAVETDGPLFSQLQPITFYQQFGVETYAADRGLEVVGGDFLSFGGASRMHVAALSLDTGVATSWDPGVIAPPNTLNIVTALAVGRATLDDLIYIGGSFTNVGGAPRRSAAAVRRADGVVTSFDPNVLNNAQVTCIATAGSQVYLGGTFSLVGGQQRQNLAEVNNATGVPTDWAPNPSGRVESIAATTNSVYFGGSFFGLSGIVGANNENYLAGVNLSVPPKLLPGFAPHADGAVRKLVLEGGELYVGGDFSLIGGQSRNRVAILDPETGSEGQLLDATIPANNSRVLAIQPAGAYVYIAGTFTSLGGENRARVASINPDLGVASSWNPGVDADVNILLLADDKLIVAGNFTRMGLRGLNPFGTSVGTFAQQYLAAFDARPGLSSFKIDSTGKPQITYRDGIGRGTSVEVQYEDALGNAGWKTLKSDDITGGHDPAVDSAGSSSAQRFYRIVVK